MFNVLPQEDTKVGLSLNLLVRDSTSRHGILPDGADHAVRALHLKDKNLSNLALEWIGNTR